MRTITLLRVVRAWNGRASALALLALPLSVPAAAPTPAKMGVTETLTTSGFHFTTGATTPPKGPPGTATPDYALALPTSFPATFSITNHTSSPIEFEIPTPIVGPGVMAIYVPSIVFKVYDAEGNLVWSSLGPPTPATPTSVLAPQPRLLKAKATWRETVQVPLELPGGEFLSGTYTLVAAVNGTPEFLATATFEVGLAP
jgi:hypothetical protein